MTPTHDMNPTAGPAISSCLQAARRGAPGADVQLMEAIYPEVRRLAGLRLKKEQRNHPLQPSALANEACLRLFRIAKDCPWEDERHLVAYCSQTLRSILVDHARKYSQERSANVELLPGVAMTHARSEELMTLDSALRRLAQIDRRAAKCIQLMWFLGLTAREVAGVLQVAERTVKRDVSMGKEFLRRFMTGETDQFRD